MNDTNPDTALGDPTPSTGPATGAAGGLFVSPDPEPALDLSAMKVWTIAEILAEAELPEKRAKICLKPNLQAEYDGYITELSTLVNARGELIVDEEDDLGTVSAEARARELGDKAQAVQAKMMAAMWYPLFRGMAEEDFAVFNKKHLPKSDDADRTDYFNLLIAECSCDPKLTVENMVALRKKLGSKAIATLVDTVTEVCVRAGVDVPKLPGFLRNLAAA
jgi:hypothetical protein